MTGLLTRERSDHVRFSAALVLLAGLAAAGGLAFAPALGGRLGASGVGPGSLVLVVVAAAAVPAVVVAVARALDVDVLVAAAAGVVATVVAVLGVTGTGPTAFAGAYRLLTSALPAVPDAAARATIGLLTGLATLIAVLLAGYARVPSLGVAVALVPFGCGLALDAAVGGPPTGYAVVVVLLVGAVLALLREPVRHANRATRDRRARLLRRVGPVLGVVVLLAVGTVAATTLSSSVPGVGSRAADPRELVAAPLRPRAGQEPMAQYPAFAQGVLGVSLRGTASQRADRLPMVTLDTFTGLTWTTSGSFRRAGTDLGDASGTPLTVRVTVGNAAPLRWLVRPDRPATLDRTGLGIDEDTGDLVVPSGTAYPTSYEVRGSTLVTPTAGLRGQELAPRVGPVATDGRAVPAALRAYAASAGGGATGYDALLTMQTRLRSDDFAVRTGSQAPSGSGYAQLIALLTGAGRHTGTSQQFASAFAVLARLMGYDSRVVLGFRPQYRGTDFTITGKDVYAWPQVRFAGAGWVSFDPTPTQGAASARTRPPPPAPARSAPPTTKPSNPSGSTAAVSTPPDATSDRSGGGGTSPLLLAVLVAVVVALLLLTPPAAKGARRRRRRGTTVPAHAVAGAWRETLDRLTELGAARRAGRTTGEVVTAAPERARDHVRAVGQLVDRAGYAPDAASPEDAAAAWGHERAAREALRSDLGRGRRLLAALDPRPLRRR